MQMKYFLKWSKYIVIYEKAFASRSIPKKKSNLSIYDETFLIHASNLVSLLASLALLHANCSSEYISEMEIKNSSLTVHKVIHKVG